MHDELLSLFSLSDFRVAFHPLIRPDTILLLEIGSLSGGARGGVGKEAGEKRSSSSGEARKFFLTSYARVGQSRQVLREENNL